MHMSHVTCASCWDLYTRKSLNFLYKSHQYRIRKEKWSVFTTTEHYDREDYKAQLTNSKEQGPSSEANTSTGRQTHALSNIFSFLITEGPNYSRSLMTTANELYISRTDCTIYWLHGVSYLFIQSHT